MSRRALPALAPLLAAALLAGCARTTDTFRPRITVDPTSTAGRERSFLVSGTVLDDTGVTQITVDGKAIPLAPGSRKLARFQFRALVQGERGQYTIAARDAAGNVGKVVLPVSVDNAAPVIKVSAFEKVGNLIRVSGTVTDNVRVAQVLVDGNRLNITPGAQVDFYAETTGVYADIEAIDAAGNRATQRAR